MSPQMKALVGQLQSALAMPAARLEEVLRGAEGLEGLIAAAVDAWGPQGPPEALRRCPHTPLVLGRPGGAQPARTAGIQGGTPPAP